MVITTAASHWLPPAPRGSRRGPTEHARRAEPQGRMWQLSEALGTANPPLGCVVPGKHRIPEVGALGPRASEG